MKFVISLVLLGFWVSEINALTILQFKAHITPEAKQLSDLLIIEQDTAHLSNLLLDSKPRAGQTLTKAQIIMWIQSKYDLTHYQWRGKQKTIVQPNTITSGLALAQKAKAALEQQLNKEHYLSFELSSDTRLPDTSLPLSAYTAVLSKEYPLAKKVCVRLNSNKHSMQVWFSVKAYQKVLVAQSAIKNRSPLHKEAFHLEKRDIAGLRTIPLTQIPPHVWLIKSLRKHQILTQQDIATKPLILKGEEVLIHVRTQGISITTKAIAQKDGYKGQWIPMNNRSTNRNFKAQIIAPHSAEIL